ITDLGLKLVHTIVVAGNGTGADVGITTNGGVTDVGEVIHLGAFADDGFFHFAEVADFGAGVQIGARAQARIGADMAGSGGDGGIKMGIGFHLGTGADTAVFDHAVRADVYAVFQHHLAFKHTTNVDHHIIAHLQ